MEHISKLSEDVGEVVFGQPKETAGTTGPDGSVLDRRKEDEWPEDTEPLGALQTSGQRLLVGTGKPTSGHLWQHWRIQCHVCSEI